MQTAPNEDIDEVRRQRDEYKELYAKMREHCRKLELGFFGQKRERFVANEAQLTMSVLGSFFVPPNKPEPETTTVPEHSRQKPTGRKALPENLPRIEVEVLPDEVKQAGTEAFERIGEDVSESIERRPASVVVVRVIRPKFVAKDRAQSEQAVLQGAPLPLPIERGLAGPGFLADSVVRRWQDHLPLHRLERIYQRESLDLARSTICTWHQSLAGLVAPLLTAMWRDALDSPYLCTDATGVLVQALEKCKSAHFFVVAAPQKHVLFAYTPKHNAQAVDQMLGEYRGYLVADAHAVYDHLYRDGRVIEVGCWAHARRYFFKALQSDPQRAQHALSLLGRVFALERANQSVSAEARLKVRQTISKPIIEQFFAWCVEQAPQVLDETPVQKAIGYAMNQEQALKRFLDDAQLPLHNNFSERALRREAIGRKNWLFVGNDEGGKINATFVSLLASCELHGLEPSAYLRDLFCLLPSWPAKDVLALAPAYWQTTVSQPNTAAALEANVFRRVALGQLSPLA